MIHARFHLQALTLRSYPYAGAEFSAVCRGEHNRSWAKATPVGKLTLGSLDPYEVDWLMAQRVDVRSEDTSGTEFDLLLDRLDPSDKRPAGAIIRRIKLMGVERDQYELDNGGTVKFQSLPREPYVEWTMKLAKNPAWDKLVSAFHHDQTEWWLAIRR